MEQIKVNDKTITTTSIVKSIEIESTKIVLNEYARFMVKLLDEQKRVLEVEVVELSGDDYSNWGSDDQYVVDFILNQLGLTKL